MKQAIYTFAAFTALAVIAPGQTQNAPAGGNSSTTISSGQQTMQGILLDANCAAIAANRSGSSITSYSGPGVAGAATTADSATQTDVPRATGASATGPGTTGAYSSDGTAGGNQADRKTTNPGSTTAVKSAPHRGPADEAMPQNRALDVPRTTSATPTGAGTPGAYTGNGVAGTGPMPRATGSPSTTPGAPDTSERARSSSSQTDTPTDSSAFTTVREKYAQCAVGPTTSSFALHSAGRIVVLDDASNQMIRDRMTSGAFSSNAENAGGNLKWMTVTVTGSNSGDRFSVSSVQTGEKR